MLDTAQMADLMSLLLDPQSPVNPGDDDDARASPAGSAMGLSRRELARVAGAASVAGMGLARWARPTPAAEEALYDPPPLARRAAS